MERMASPTTLWGKSDVNCLASFAFQSVFMGCTIDTDAVSSWMSVAAAFRAFAIAIPEFGEKQHSFDAALGQGHPSR